MSGCDHVVLSPLQLSGHVFTGVFTVEMLFKVVALGFFFNGKFSYIRDGWNILDFVVVALGYVSLASDNNVSALRSMRILRPLKTINQFPSVRILVSSLLKSISHLGDVLTLFAFIFFLFGIVGMQLFGGDLTNRCQNTNTQSFGDLCGNFQCASNEVCVDTGTNPNRGVTGFDNIFQAWLTILQVTCCRLVLWCCR